VTFHLPENSQKYKIETTKATKRNLISDDFEQLSVKLMISVDSKSADFSRAGSWCFEAETEETTTTTTNVQEVTSLFVWCMNYM